MLARVDVSWFVVSWLLAHVAVSWSFLDWSEIWWRMFLRLSSVLPVNNYGLYSEIATEIQTCQYVHKVLRSQNFWHPIHIKQIACVESMPRKQKSSEMGFFQMHHQPRTNHGHLSLLLPFLGPFILNLFKLYTKHVHIVHWTTCPTKLSVTGRWDD